MVARYIPAEDIINRAASEVGLTPTALPFQSTDPAFKQLVQLLTSCGQELLAMNPTGWTQFYKEGSIVTTGSPNRYDVPEDYLCFVPQSGWDPQSDRRLGGGLTPQIWNVVTNYTVVSNLYISYREAQNQFWLQPTDTPAGITIPYEYVRRTWVLESPSTYKDVPTVEADLILYEPLVIIRLLKLRFLGARGFDTTAAFADFRQAFEMYSGANVSAEPLRLDHRPKTKLLDISNIPESGLG